MRLLILTQYYPPETGAPQNRLSDLAQRLVARGHRVQVLTALPNYPGNAVFDTYRGRANTVEVLDGIEVARVGLYVPRSRALSRRMLSYFSFAYNARRYGPRLVEPVELILMESPPPSVALAAVALARRMKARLVINISDLWPGSLVELAVGIPRPLIWAAERLEAWMYRRADLITGQTQGIVHDIQTRFPAKRVVLFPNGVDVGAYQQPLDRDGIRKEFGWTDEHFVVGYTGILGIPQALDQVLDAALLLDDVPNLHFAFFGEGVRKEHLQARIARENITSARVYPHQARERMPHIQAALDAGLVPLSRGKVFEGARPSKMFEIMAAGRPLVVCACGEAAVIVNGASGGPAGVVAPPEEPAVLAQRLRPLLFDREAARQMGRRGQAYVYAHFDREQIAGQLEQELLGVVTPPE